ncbi:MAG: DUF4375 domain-containing protein [Clostridia bacterium]|nr:DUF4375 domain-containing protein [Clostridia bacterium]
MKIKDLFDDIQNPEYSVYDYVLNKSFDYEDEKEFIESIDEILKLTYVIHRFIDEINSGGLDYYYDVFAPYRELEDCLIKIKSDNVLNLIKESNNLIYKVENRIKTSITDNIEYITDEESDKLQELNSLYYKYEDEFVENFRNYILDNQELEFNEIK